LITRVLGFVRERLFAQYFGIGVEADAFGAAMKIPNVIRNLLGEGTLSASFIPVYAGMIERGETENARRLAGTIVSILVLLTAGAAFLGILLAPIITDIAAPGFSGHQRDLTITLVRILFPMFGALILSAWCLGILNTHRRFFLSYAAPSVWNIAQIATLVGLGGHLFGKPLVIALAWGAVIGSVAQIAVQLPTVLPLVRGMRWGLSADAPGVRRVIRAWIPVVFGAGVVQISSVIDTQLASLLPSGSVAALRFAQLIAILPVSLFGVGVAAVALPELSRDAVGASHDALKTRLAEGLRQLAFFVIPSAFAFAALGSAMVGALFETGSFDSRDTALVAGVLAAYAIAVPAQTSIKILASGHYALGDTKTPVRIAILAIVVSASSGFALMQYFGPAGIALGAAIGAYLNVVLNSIKLRRRLGSFLARGDVRSFIVSAFSAVLAALAGGEVAALLSQRHIWLEASCSMFVFSAVYGVITLVLRHPEAKRLVQAMRRPGRQ
jgi:putative peptidoglycan lipid II flippase